MKKLYEELTLEIIRFGALDIITASDAAEAENKDDATAKDDTATKDDTSTTEDPTTGDDGGSDGPVFWYKDEYLNPPPTLTGETFETSYGTGYLDTEGRIWLPYDDNTGYSYFGES